MTGVLILFAHPNLERSRVNRTMRDAVAGLEQVTVHDLYDAYPDFDIDVAAEQARAEAHHSLVFHHPFYWYSCPAILKEWMDLVLTHGWAYGQDGTALSGKQLMSAVSTGGSVRAYAEGGSTRHTITQFLAPFDQTANLCGMNWQEPFVFHGTHDTNNEAIEQHAVAYRARIEALRDAGAT